MNMRQLFIINDQLASAWLDTIDERPVLHLQFRSIMEYVIFSENNRTIDHFVGMNENRMMHYLLKRAHFYNGNNRTIITTYLN